ncbi:MAG: extracellular solute-binding protein [candidate division WS1 bacterium]|nr:extracellular solute-binding protein [candidate division WS1 bacterium]
MPPSCSAVPRALALVAALTLATVGLVACARKPQEGPSGAGGVSAPARTVVRFASVWVNPPRQPALEKVVEEFEALHPEIDIEVTYTAPDDYKMAIRTQVAAGEAPDVFFVWPGEWLWKFARGEQVMDLTDELAKDGWGDQFLPNSMPLFQYEGRAYGVPMLMQCKYFFYNPEMFAERGLSEPQTWDDLITICETFKREEIVPIALSNTDRWPLHHYATILWQRLVGEDQLLRDLDRATGGAYAHPGYRQGLEMLEELVTRGYFTPGANGEPRDSARLLFATEQSPMFFTATWDLGWFLDERQTPPEFIDKWDMFQFPSVPGGEGNQDYMMGAPDGYAVYSGTKVKDAALTWLRYFTSPEVGRQLVTELQELVCVQGAVTDQNAGRRLQKYANDLSSAPGVIPWADIMLESSAREAFLDALQGMLDGTVSPEGVLQRLREAHAQARVEAASE